MINYYWLYVEKNKSNWKYIFCRKKNVASISEINANQSQVAELLPSSLWGQAFGSWDPPQFETPHLPIPPKTPPHPPAPQRTPTWSCSSSWCRPQTIGPQALPSPSLRLRREQKWKTFGKSNGLMLLSQETDTNWNDSFLALGNSGHSSTNMCWLSMWCLKKIQNVPVPSAYCMGLHEKQQPKGFLHIFARSVSTHLKIWNSIGWKN